MRNRFSSHLVVLFALVAIEITGYYAIHRAAMIRGYETSVIGAARDLLMYLPIIVMALWVSAFKKFKGNWVLFTTAILLFSIGLLVQYRLYSDPEYNAKNKAVAIFRKRPGTKFRPLIPGFRQHTHETKSCQNARRKRRIDAASDGDIRSAAGNCLACIK